MRGCFDTHPCRRDDAVVIAGRQGDPGPDLVRLRLDLGVVGFLPEGQCGWRVVSDAELLTRFSRWL